jgi:amino acid adenylation domain-containing protein
MITTITDYLDISELKYKDKVCFLDENKKLTFTKLKEESQAIASMIISKGFFKNSIVIIMDKNVNCISTFLGVAYSGNYYTPMDVSMPLSRINKIIKILNPVMIITNEKNKNIAHKIDFDGKIAVYEHLVETKINESAINIVKNKIIDTDILYILFTSGSTGTPKGIAINHKSVIDYTEWVSKTFTITSNDVFGNQAPFYFDNSILDIYCTLKNGSKMFIIPQKLFTFPIKLLEFINDNKINIIFWVPSAMCIIANLKALEKTELNHLKKILFCGEVMPNKQLNYWRKHVPHAIYANLYGPTEITDVCTYYIIDREFKDSDPLPIGKPCKNTDIIILNEVNELVKDGEIGELCVRGSSLAMGYFNDQEKTNKAFVQNPLNPYYNELIYRTGDLVKYNELGEIIYISRKDFQIKHQGHRIELGEIEIAINSIESIKSCCCLYDEISKKIVLFYLSDKDINDIINEVKNIIPSYMIPNKKVKLDSMPLNANGKIDRVALRGML